MRARSPSMWPLIALAFAAMAIRAIAFAPTELYADEAYYWLWSRQLAAGYFDHPPAVAWLIRGGTALLGGESGVRLLAVLCGGATVVFAGLLARELSDDPRAPLWGALLTVAAPLLHVAGALALPDAPVVASYTAAAWLLARARGRRWIAVGVAVGVALLSKYTAGLLAPALVLLVVFDRELRADLRSGWPWLAGLVALALFAPCLLWNARHGWISIAFQLRHGFGAGATWGSFAEFLVGQLVGAGPVALVGGVVFLAARSWSSPPARRTAAVTLVPLAVTVVAAMRGKVEANWPALVYPSLAAGAAALLASRPRLGRPIVAASTALSLLLLVAFSVEQRHPRLLAGTPVIERFHGWRELAEIVQGAAARACPGLGCDPRNPFVVPASYQYAAALAFYGQFGRLGPALERPSQLDLWGARPGPGEAFLAIGFEGMDPRFLQRLEGSGERPTERRAVTYQGRTVRTVTVTPFAHYAGELAGR